MTGDLTADADALVAAFKRGHTLGASGLDLPDDDAILDALQIMPSPPRSIPVRDLMDTLEVRKYLGGKGPAIQRGTLAYYRDKHDFPAPIKRFGKSTNARSLYDRRMVRAWLRGYRKPRATSR